MAAGERSVTVGRWIIKKVDTKAYRAGKVRGKKHYNHGSKKSEKPQDSIRQMMEGAGGRLPFLRQVAELEKAGLLEVRWVNVNTDVSEIIFPVENMPRLCRHEGIEDSRSRILKARAQVEKWYLMARTDWLREYYAYLMDELEQGILPENCKDDTIFLILNALEKISQDIYKREFSAKLLKHSKLFEEKYEKRIVTILKRYSSRIRDTADSMGDAEILAEHGIITYSQTLEFKGGLVLQAGDAEPVDASRFRYGTVLNAQTLSHANLLSLGNIRKIITIENKANYESMLYEPETLYIYTHGFLSPKERVFLKQITEMADSSMSYFHWSDMDYGGIRIFQFMKKEVFPALQPIYMDRDCFERARVSGAGIELSPEKRRKLELLEAGCLEGLKRAILESGLEIEQENILGL